MPNQTATVQASLNEQRNISVHYNWLGYMDTQHITDWDSLELTSTLEEVSENLPELNKDSETTRYLKNCTQQ